MGYRRFPAEFKAAAVASMPADGMAREGYPLGDGV